MQELTKLLKDPKEKPEEWFRKIADELMSNYMIDTGNVKYRLLEIEFYYHSEQHKDETTYGYAKEMKKLPLRVQRHKLAQQNQLTWFIHYSGIDIVLGSKDKPGGILIRVIQNEDTLEIMDGPLVVLLELMNQGMSVDGNSPLQLRLVKRNSPLEISLQQKERKGLGNGANPDRLYNFFVNPIAKPS